MKTPAAISPGARPGALSPTRAAPRRSETAGLRPVAGLIPAITRKAFEKHGFAAASLITDWAGIVGSQTARLTRPERLKWPRPLDTGGDPDDAARSGRPGATLVLRVDPAAALEIQYRTAQLLERVNAYFGYRAVSDLRIVQAGSDEEIGTPERARPDAVTVAAAHRNRRVASARSAVAVADLSAVEDESLRAALARLAASIGGSGNGDPP